MNSRLIIAILMILSFFTALGGASAYEFGVSKDLTPDMKTSSSGVGSSDMDDTQGVSISDDEAANIIGGAIMWIIIGIVVVFVIIAAVIYFVFRKIKKTASSGFDEKF